MKKIINLTIIFLSLIYISACSGYKPIFSSNLQFKIEDYSIQGNKKLGRQIYEKIYRLSDLNKESRESQGIYIFINSSIKKEHTAKNSKGKIIEYEISLNSQIEIKDYLSDNKILRQNFNHSSSYKVQDQHSETVKLENKTIENLLNNTFQDLLIKMSESIIAK